MLHGVAVGNDCGSAEQDVVTKTLNNLNNDQGQFLHMKIFGFGGRETLNQIVDNMLIMRIILLD